MGLVGGLVGGWLVVEMVVVVELVVAFVRWDEGEEGRDGVGIVL